MDSLWHPLLLAVETAIVFVVIGGAVAVALYGLVLGGLRQLHR